MEASTPPGEALEKTSATMTISELRAAALASMRARASAPLDVGSGTSEATAVYQPELAMLPGNFLEQGELVGYTNIVMNSGLAADANVGASASSKPDDDFDALLLQYQNSASRPTATSEQTVIGANAYGEMPDRSSYYDYDSGRMIYGVDRYSSPAPALPFGGGGVGQTDRNAGYLYQGAQWPIPGLSYFPGPDPSQQHTQSTFNMLNQYHMQLRMLMSPSPRPAEPFVPERFGQAAYPPPPPLPTVPQSLPLPPFAGYGGFVATASNTAAPIHRPATAKPVTDDGLLSDGELESVSGDYGHEYSDSDRDRDRDIDATAAIAAAGVGGISLTSRQEAHQDVEGIVKERISQMLKMKDPRLLQGSSFRALMLLLKCIRLDDPDVIYAAVKSAPVHVISELNALSAEFGLDMITEACVTTLLAADAESLHANLALGAAEAVAMTGSSAEPPAGFAQPGEDSWAHVPAPDSDGVKMEIRPPSSGNESSTPNSDMDTSSDVDYEDQPSPPQQPAVDSQPANPRSSAQPMPPLSRETTPQFHARFSRSRAPSPPSAQPRTPRRLSYARKSPTPSDREARGLARIGGSMLSMHSGLSIRNSHLFNGADQSWRVLPPPSLSRESPEPVQPVAESTVCVSEAGQLVVYLDHSDSNSDVSSSTSSECDDDDDDDGAQSARNKAYRLENRMINKECRRLAQEEAQLANPGLDISTRPSAASSAAATAASRVSTPADSAKLSNEALLKAKEDIRAQEAAIARLKTEISRKQTKMLLRKKLHESKLRRAHVVTSSATAPATPYSEVESSFPSPELSTANSPAFRSSASLQSLSSASGSCAPDTQHDRASEDISQSMVSAPCSPGRDEAGEALAGPQSDVENDVVMPVANVALLPECGPCEQMIQQAPPEARSTHISNIMALLKGATQSKNSELRSIMRGTSALAQSDLEKLKLSASQIDERLFARQATLREQRDNVSKRISALQAELGLFDMELDILSYSQAANRSYCAALEPTASSSGSAASAATANGSRAVELRNEITAVHQFMDSMFRAADTSNETTASDSDLAMQTSKMALVPGGLPPATTSQQSSAPPPQRELGTLRAKLVAMKQEQTSMAHKLTRLVEKRKGSEPSQSALPIVKRSKADPGLRATPPLSAPGSARTTSIAKLLAALEREAAKHVAKNPLKWGNLLCVSADDCIIQQLPIVDGIGMQRATDLGQSLLSGTASSEQTDARVAAGPSQQHTEDVVGVSAAVAPRYSPYQSPLSASASARVRSGGQSSNAGLDKPSRVDESIGLSDVALPSLYGLMTAWPSMNPRMAPQYYSEMEQALRQVETGPDGMASNEAIARALLPVVSTYLHAIPSIPIAKTCSLRRALGLHVKPKSKPKDKLQFASFAGGVEREVLQIDDISTLKRSMSKVAGFMPILNRDVARMSYSSLAAQLQPRQQHLPASAPPFVRYYDASASSESQPAISGTASGNNDDGDGDDDEPELYVGAASNSSTCVADPNSVSNDSDGETEIASADDGPDARYRRALRLLWHECPVSGPFINEVHVMGYLHSAANKSVGNALVFLKQSLQLHPRSEKLWDLCLELFSRQPVAAQEVIAAFNDATKFNPSSTCLWQRYMHWCNWNIAHGVNSLGDCAVWHSRLSALALAAVKSHVDMQQSPPAERISASLAEIMVCIWEGLWTLLEQQITWSARSGVAPKSAFLKAQLISQMSACLWAKSPMELYTLVSGISADGDSHGPPSRDGGELVFARLLLPHHFLHLGLVFLHCFVAGTFVPQSVLVRMNAALTTSPGRPITAHHLSPRKIADVLPAALELDGALKPHIVSVIRKFFADLQMTLSSYDLSEPADPSYSVITQSLAVCRASMNQTLTQLKQCSPVETAPLINGCEDLFCWIAENPLGSLDIKGLPELIFSHGGIGMFTMVAQLLSKCDLAHNDYASCEMAVHVLREHALLVARQLKVAPTTAMPIVWPVSSVMDTRKVLKRLQRRIVDCRALYYQILGYTGPAQPRSVNTLALGLVNRARDESLEHSRLLLCSGIWINIAAIEFLASRFSADSPSVDVQAIDSALCWLNYGLKHHVANDFGARVQMWAIVLQITAVKRSLTEKDIVLVHHDLGYDADSDALHSPRTDFMPINDVLRPLLLTASSDTLEAVKSYIMHAGYANTELALRLIVCASTSDKPNLNLRGFFQHIQRRNASDPLLAEM